MRVRSYPHIIISRAILTVWRPQPRTRKLKPLNILYRYARLNGCSCSETHCIYIYIAILSRERLVNLFMFYAHFAQAITFGSCGVRFYVYIMSWIRSVRRRIAKSQASSRIFGCCDCAMREVYQPAKGYAQMDCVEDNERNGPVAPAREPGEILKPAWPNNYF